MKLTEMLTMRPKRRSTMPGHDARIISSAEKKCMSSQRSHSSRGSVRKSAGVWRTPGIGDQDVGVGTGGDRGLRPRAW